MKNDNDKPESTPALLTRARERSDAIGEVERKVAEMQRDFAEGRDVVEGPRGAQTDEQRARAWWNAQDYHDKPEQTVSSLTELLGDVRAHERGLIISARGGRDRASASPAKPESVAMAIRLARFEAFGEAASQFVRGVAYQGDVVISRIEELRSAARPREQRPSPGAVASPAVCCPQCSLDYGGACVHCEDCNRLRRETSNAQAPEGLVTADWIVGWFRQDSRRTNGVTEKGDHIVNPFQLVALLRAHYDERRGEAERALRSGSVPTIDADRFLAEENATVRFWIDQFDKVSVEVKIDGHVCLGESIQDVADYVTAARAAKHPHGDMFTDKRRASSAAPTDVPFPMPLDEAIEHAREKGNGNTPCAAAYRQLAAWLVELRGLRTGAEDKST